MTRASPGVEERAGPLGRWSAGLRASIAAGLVAVLPLGLTIWLMWAFAGWVDRAVMPLIPGWLTPGRYVGLDPRGRLWKVTEVGLAGSYFWADSFSGWTFGLDLKLGF